MGWMTRFRFPTSERIFFFHQQVQTGSRDHPASYPMGICDSFPGVTATAAWSWPVAFI